MRNVELTLDGDILTAKIDLSKECGPSKSGKTMVIATTGGNLPLAEKPEIRIGINVYRPRTL